MKTKTKSQYLFKKEGKIKPTCTIKQQYIVILPLFLIYYLLSPKLLP